MAQRPNRYARWAYNAIGAYLVEPSAPYQAGGFNPLDRPPAAWINFLFNLQGGWVDYLRGPSLVDWVRRATGVTLVTNPRVGIDTTTPEGATSPVRYAIAGNGGGGPAILSSTRGVTWANVTANLPGTLISSAVRGIGVMGGARWLFWTALQVFSTLRDTSGTSGLNVGGPAWTLATVPGGLVAVGGVAADPATSTIMLAYDAAGPAMRFAYSLDNGITFSAAGVTGGPPTGATGDVVWNGKYFVAVSGAGEVWHTTGYLANWTLASTQASSALWKLAATPTGVIALYEVNRASGTRILTSSDHGATWTAVTVPADVNNLTKLAWADNAWVASSTDAPYVWASNDLAVWNRAVLPHPDPADAIYDLAYGEGAYTAVGLTVAYQSDHAYDAGPGPADGLTAPVIVTVYGASALASDYLGGVKIATRTVSTTPFAVDSGGVSDHLIEVDTSALAITVNLPTPSAAVARRRVVVQDDTGNAPAKNITVAVTGGSTINGLASQPISTAWGSRTFRCNNAGTAWRML